MENPATWGRAELIVCEAMERSDRLQALEVSGLSTVRMITDALRAEGLLKEEA